MIKKKKKKKKFFYHDIHIIMNIIKYENKITTNDTLLLIVVKTV